MIDSTPQATTHSIEADGIAQFFLITSLKITGSLTQHRESDLIILDH